MFAVFKGLFSTTNEIPDCGNVDELYVRLYNSTLSRGHVRCCSRSYVAVFGHYDCEKKCFWYKVSNMRGVFRDRKVVEHVGSLMQVFVDKGRAFDCEYDRYSTLDLSDLSKKERYEFDLIIFAAYNEISDKRRLEKEKLVINGKAESAKANYSEFVKMMHENNASMS